MGMQKYSNHLNTDLGLIRGFDRRRTRQKSATNKKGKRQGDITPELKLGASNSHK